MFVQNVPMYKFCQGGHQHSAFRKSLEGAFFLDIFWKIDIGICSDICKLVPHPTRPHILPGPLNAAMGDCLIGCILM